MVVASIVLSGQTHSVGDARPYVTCFRRTHDTLRRELFIGVTMNFFVETEQEGSEQ
jgi:hypothetical protein